ncbi:MAG: hypothetical protein WCR21_09160 [Bacteroidota bacterium]
MDQAHLHLLITHLPLFGSFLGALVLIYGISKKSEVTNLAAYYVFIISAIGAGIAYFTGEAAEESVEEIAGILKDSIKFHEDFAFYTIICMCFLGFISLLGLILTIKKLPFTNSISYLILVISVLGFFAASRTAYLGGQIRHTTLNKNLNPTIELENHKDDD